MNNIYIDFETSDLTIEDHGEDGKFLDAMNIYCHVHGFLKAYPYDERLEWDDLMDFVTEHQRVMHFG